MLRPLVLAASIALEVRPPPMEGALEGCERTVDARDSNGVTRHVETFVEDVWRRRGRDRASD